MTKQSREKQLHTERRIVAAIRDKMEALAQSQFLKKRKTSEKSSKGSPYEGISKAELRKIKNKKADGIRTEIDLLLRSFGLKPHIHPPHIPKATQEESMAIRFDFDGILHRPRTIDLSEGYLKHKQLCTEYFALTGDSNAPQYQISDYNLSNSEVWKKLNNFSNFRQLRKRICRQLAENGIPPSILPEMNYFDFIDTIVDFSKKTKNRPFESARSKNLKMFAHCYGQEFSSIMTALRIDQKVTRKILDKMRQGFCDELLDVHHKTNVTNFKELENPYDINKFPNMLLTFIHPHHRSLHFGRGYDIDKDVVFFGGYNPAFQIKRNPEKEREYLIKAGQLKKNDRTY